MQNGRTVVIGLMVSLVLFLYVAMRNDGSNLLVLLGVLSPRGEEHLITIPGSVGVGVSVRTLISLSGALLAVVVAPLWLLSEIVRGASSETPDQVHDVVGVDPSVSMGGGSGFDMPMGGFPMDGPSSPGMYGPPDMGMGMGGPQMGMGGGMGPPTGMGF